MAPIQLLQPDVIAQLRSSKQITSLNGVVLGLLENSLDAGSSKVKIMIDSPRGACTVEDDGSGIGNAEFGESGGLGKMHYTSRHVSGAVNRSYGESGTFLASLCALSYLVITSHATGEIDGATIVWHQGKVITREIPTKPGNQLDCGVQHGTRVAVRDLFGNMPVRVKQRALTACASEAERQWHELKRGILALLLAWPRPCSIRIQDQNESQKSINCFAQYPLISNALTERHLNSLTVPRSNLDLKDKLPMLMQAGLVTGSARPEWIPVSASSPIIALKGYIGRQPVPTQQCQFISIDIHPCDPSSGSNELYSAVNKTFAKSGFGSVDGNTYMDTTSKDRRDHDRRYKHDGYTQKQLSGRKGVDRWPMFILQIKHNDHRRGPVDPESFSEGSLKAITELLTIVATQWLGAHGFRLQKRRRRKIEAQQSPAANELMSSPSAIDARQAASHDLIRPSTPAGRSMSYAIATTSKKRKFVDLTGQTHPIDSRPATGPAASTNFNSWSRIKAGRREDVHPPVQDMSGGRVTGLNTRGNPAAFSLPVVRAGASSKRIECGADAHKESASIGRSPDPGPKLLYSSDDYGSVDSENLLAAAETAEKGRSQSQAPFRHATSQGAADGVVEWHDPVTKQAFKVNARTGVVLPVRLGRHLADDDAASCERHPAAIKTSLTSTGKPLLLAKRLSTADSGTKSRSLPGFIKDWNNPIFAQQIEEPIQVLSLATPAIDDAGPINNRRTRTGQISDFAEADLEGTSKLTKEGLLQAKIVRQVDNKFILCKMQTSHADSALVLVDQHAASERVILEGLLKELCLPSGEDAVGAKSKVKTMLLAKPLRIQVSSHEEQLLRDRAAHFADWGILYDVKQRRPDMSASQVRQPPTEHFVVVTALPQGIAERCSQSPQLIIDLLRTEIWQDRARKSAPLEQSDGSSDHKDDDHSWLRRIASCPRGVLDMLNSRACRSAIMFNDELSPQQCEELLADLAKCAFPFMCAHGRVSMVPLVETGDGVSESLFAKDVAGEVSFGTAYKRWRELES